MAPTPEPGLPGQENRVSQRPERGFLSVTPATEWTGGAVTGNGTLGALIYGLPGDETVVLNHARLYMPLHEPRPAPDTASRLPELRGMLAAGQYRAAADRVVQIAAEEGYPGKLWTDPFIPACDIRIVTPGTDQAREYRRRVDFRTGLVELTWTGDRGAYRRRLFASRPDNLVVLRIDGPEAPDIALAARPAAAPGGWNAERMFAEGIRDITLDTDEDGSVYRSTFRQSWPGSLVGYTVTARIIRRPDSVLVLARVCLGTDDAREALAAIPPDFDGLLARHAAVHGLLFDRCRLDLGGSSERDTPVEDLIARAKSGPVPAALREKLFDAGRYAVLSATGDLFPNLQGIWTGTWSPPWSGDFTMNGNVQCALVANLPGNLAECLLPYFDYLESQLPEYRENARRLYGCRGIHVPSRTSTHGRNNHFDGTWPMTFWTAGAGWAAQFYHDYWLYTGDREFLLTRAIPFMKEAALFYEDFLTEGADGRLLFSPSYSPENHPANSESQACVNATMDVAVARELFANLLAACREAGVEADAIPRWERLAAKLPEYRINGDGALAEWATPLLEDHYAHRHCSHFYALYAGLPTDIAAHPDLRRAFLTAAEKRMEVRRREDGGIMAFGLVQLGAAVSSLGDGAMAGEVADWLARNYWNTNLVSTHNPGDIFNTDICGGFPALILKMLADSRPGRIDLLPALPPEWASGRVAGVRCRGRAELRELSWDPERATVTLVSDVPREIRIGLAGHAPRVVRAGAGEPVRLEFRRTPPPAEPVGPVTVDPSRRAVATRVTDPDTGDGQLLYFTSPSLTADDRHLVFISNRTGNPNLFVRDLETGTERQLTGNTEGVLKSYVYFDGTPYRGFGKGSVSLDAQRGTAYYIQGREIRAVTSAGRERVLAELPEGQMTAFTHVSADGALLCVPTTDARALDGDRQLTGRPDFDIDRRVVTEGLSSHLRVYETATGTLVRCERVPKAWITHVQFSPADAGLILYNHEYCADSGIRRMWLWDGKTHRPLRDEGQGRSRHDWTCHEMWERDGQAVMYHGTLADGPAYVGRVRPDGTGRVEIRLPDDWRSYGHFTVGGNGLMVTDGCYGEPGDGGWGGAWISLLQPDWERGRIRWFPVARHGSGWGSQDSHPHPVFDHAGRVVYFTSDPGGRRAVYRVVPGSPPD